MSEDKRTAHQIAAAIVSRFVWTSNCTRNGHLVSQGMVVRDEIAAAIDADLAAAAAELTRLRKERDELVEAAAELADRICADGEHGDGFDEDNFECEICTAIRNVRAALARARDSGT